MIVRKLTTLLLCLAIGGCAEHPHHMIPLPGGHLRQGSPENEAGRRSVEGPEHDVEVPAFSLSRTEVTVAEFRRFVTHTGYQTDAERNQPIDEDSAAGCWSHHTFSKSSAGWVSGRSWRDPGFPQGDAHPVVCVSWNDATTYVEWFRTATGIPYRLPTESEFEYVHQGGSSTPWPWTADAVPCQFTNQADLSLARAMSDWRRAIPEIADCDDGHAFTAPVESYPQNVFALHDVVGNVSEWVQDCWHDDYLGAPTNGRAWEPDAGAECSDRVLKGGDFVSSPDRFRSAHRTSIPPSFRTYHVGFRVALTTAP